MENLLKNERMIAAALCNCGHTDDVKISNSYGLVDGVCVFVGGGQHAIRFAPTDTPDIGAIVDFLGPYADRRMG